MKPHPLDEERSPEHEQWLVDNKERFKVRYGDDWQKMLYARGNVLFKSDEVNEEDTSVSTTTDGVDNGDAQPLTMTLKRDKFIGLDCISMDDDTYMKCVKGKVPFARWSGYVEDEEMREQIKRMYQKSNRLLVKNERTGAMAYLK